MVERIRVLVVEDHVHLRKQLQILLEDYDGINVIGAAEDGKKAIALCAELHPDVVLMDAVMPIMDGFTATEIIREKSPEIQVVILTNGRLGEDDRATEAGAGAFLLKPVSTEYIVQTIRKVYYTSHRAHT
jgi:DNA-binding NarL/FixJ family response regulator